MKLKGKEKYFWERIFDIKRLEDIPSSLNRIVGIDSEHDDAFFYYLSERVQNVAGIRLRCTNVTDDGVKYISKLKGLRELMLKDHRGITKESLPAINELTDLESLDISKNNFSIKDLYALTHLKKLQQLTISSDLPDAETEAELEKLRAHFPGCEIVVY
jgi:Leucine-rich repeat (LRR) protein